MNEITMTPVDWCFSVVLLLAMLLLIRHVCHMLWDPTNHLAEKIERGEITIEETVDVATAIAVAEDLTETVELVPGTPEHDKAMRAIKEAEKRMGE